MSVGFGVVMVDVPVFGVRVGKEKFEMGEDGLQETREQEQIPRPAQDDRQWLCSDFEEN